MINFGLQPRRYFDSYEASRRYAGRTAYNTRLLTAASGYLATLRGVLVINTLHDTYPTNAVNAHNLTLIGVEALVSYVTYRRALLADARATEGPQSFANERANEIAARTKPVAESSEPGVEDQEPRIETQPQTEQNPGQIESTSVSEQSQPELPKREDA
ncbi:MAG: hypothetical protein ABWX94_00770 [Candidatus Saccharimonadales bacterium]